MSLYKIKAVRNKDCEFPDTFEDTVDMLEHPGLIAEIVGNLVLHDWVDVRVTMVRPEDFRLANQVISYLKSRLPAV